MGQNAGNPRQRWSRCSARAEHRGPGRALANPEGKRGLQGQFQARVGKPMIQSKILQTHSAWLLLSTPVTAACSSPARPGHRIKSNSTGPFTAQDDRSDLHKPVLSASAHSVLLLSRVSPHPLSLFLSCLGQLSTPGDSRSSPISVAEQGASALERECEEPRLS